MLAMRPAAGSPSVASRSDAAASLPNVTDSMYEAALECAICDKKFHAFRRKHRCRSCGNAVCGSCARTHKMMPSSMLLRTNNEPVRVCDRCISGQTQMMQERRRMEDAERARARQQAALQEDRLARMLERTRLDEILAQQLEMEERQKAALLHSLELKHFGPPPTRPTIRRRRSTGHISTLKRQPLGHQKAIDVFIADAEKRAQEILGMAGIKPTASSTLRSVTPQATAAATIVRQATAVPEADECAICLDAMEVGNAIYTTACGHSFHWGCLKDIQLSDAANADKCPSCRATMEEMQVKKQCDHPRVRLGHRFCRDCGLPVTERDVKSRPNEDGTMMQLPPPPPQQQRRQQAPPPGAGGSGQITASYRAGSHGALVRCPQCQIQMRVLPHMYNMRVACPSGHMFLVQVAGQVPPGGGLGGRGRAPPRGSPGYPGYH